MDALSRRLPAAVALVAVTLLAVAAWLAELPPAPAGRDAPPGSFSVERAWPVLERIAGEPTPVGSAAGDAVRDHLVAELTRLGLRPEVQTGAGAHPFGGDVVAGVTENVIAVVPGADSTGRVVLAAHYDSTPTTPGASDDKASVAAILEIARALRAGPPLRNDLVLLLSDGEEPGLIGAEAFLRHPMARDGGVVVNLEGPGNAAPSSVYNVTPGGGALVGAFARAMPHPVGESAMVGAYRGTGFHSDLTVLEENGWIGIDLGLAGGRAYYHHPRDTPAALDRAALQMQGDNALAMVRELGSADLRELRQPRDEVFFTIFGVVFRYPAGLATPLAVLAALAVLALAAYTRLSARPRRAEPGTDPDGGVGAGPASGGTRPARTRAATRFGGAAPVTVPRLVAGMVAVLGVLVVVTGLSMGLWPALVALEPGYGDLVSDPYRPEPYRLGLVMMAVAVVWGAYVALRRWLNAVVLTVGVLFWLAVLGVAAALLMPGASNYGSLTALAGAAGLAGALALRRRPVLGTVVLACGVAPAVVMFSVGARSISTAIGLVMAAPAGLFYAFAALSALPLLAAVTPGGGRTPAAVPARGEAPAAVPARGGAPVQPTGVGPTTGAEGGPGVRVGRRTGGGGGGRFWRWVGVWGGPVVAGVLALVLGGVGLGVNRFGEERPRLAHLAYVLDADARQAAWVSMTEPPHPWAAERAPDVPGSWDLPLPYRQVPARVGTAPAAGLPAPELTVLEERRDGGETTLRVRVRSQRGAYQLNLHADVAVIGGSFEVPGLAPVTLPAYEPEGGAWPFEVQFFAPPEEGVEFTLRFESATRPRLAVADITLGLDGVPGHRPRPAGVDMTPSGGGLPTDSVTVVRVL
ncbi:M28 family peptidase [Nonomuraea ferruginea]|uniref:M28 family peptidase n=1 Tax=Nonomuraea ferruginea TaxID=46174 RepID=A0ABT4T3U1_9ACTN|nr:M28 family peptidase [Nonomuraea ferruginea]MDA0643995.1 M28 family peptidase [Nonomuraea ferruginea]